MWASCLLAPAGAGRAWVSEFLGRCCFGAAGGTTTGTGTPQRREITFSATCSFELVSRHAGSGSVVAGLGDTGAAACHAGLVWCRSPSNIGVLPKSLQVTWPLVGHGVAMAPFGSSHTVLDGNSTPDSPKGATMPRHRFIISALLAAALLAAGCGGDDAAEEPEDAAQETDSVSEVTTDADQPDAPVRDSTDQPDAGAEPESEPQPVLVRLGDRFGWCADIQRTWDWLAEIQGQVDAEEAALRDAQEALEAAADELDRAEALQVFESADRRVADLTPILVDANDDVVKPVQPGWRSREDTEVIAVERARDAFLATTDPALVELLAAAYSDASLNEEPTEPADDALEEPETAGEALSPEELLSELEQLRDEVQELWRESIRPYSAVQNAPASIHAAQNPTDAMDAYEWLLEDASALDEIRLAAWMANTTAGDLYQAYRYGVGETYDAGEISLDQYHRLVDGANATRQAIGNTHIPDTRDPKRLGRAAVEEATNAFVLADTAWGAFQVSLSESCQP